MSLSEELINITIPFPKYLIFELLEQFSYDELFQLCKDIDAEIVCDYD